MSDFKTTMRGLRAITEGMKECGNCRDCYYWTPVKLDEMKLPERSLTALEIWEKEEIGIGRCDKAETDWGGLPEDNSFTTCSVAMAVENCGGLQRWGYGFLFTNEFFGCNQFEPKK